MSEAAAGESQRWSRRKIAWIAGLWITAVGLFVGKQVWVNWIIGNRRSWTHSHGEFLFPSGDLWNLGTFGPFALIAAALGLQSLWYRGTARDASGCGLFLLIPVAILVYLVAPFHSPRVVDRAELADGRRYVLARMEFFKAPACDGLYEVTGPLGSQWWQVSYVGCWFDSRPNEARRLVVSGDQRWLLVEGPSYWVICFHVAQGGFENCDELDPSPREERGRDTGFGPQTRRYTALTGMRPESIPRE